MRRLLILLLTITTTSVWAAHTARPAHDSRGVPSGPGVVHPHHHVPLLHAPPRPPPRKGHFEFGMQPLYYPSFQLLSKAFRRVALAQGAYALAAVSIGDYHENSLHDFRLYTEQAILFRDWALPWHAADPDPVRRTWVEVRLGILNKEIDLMTWQINHLPPPNVVVEGVVDVAVGVHHGVVHAAHTVKDGVLTAARVAKKGVKRVARVALDAIKSAGWALGQVARGIAYGTVLIVGGIGLAIYKSIEFALKSAKQIALGLLKVLKAALKYFPIQWVSEGRTSEKTKFSLLDHHIREHYDGNWSAAERNVLLDTSGFSYVHSSQIGDNANNDLGSYYVALNEEQRNDISVRGGYRPGLDVEWTNQVDSIESHVVLGLGPQPQTSDH